MPKAQDPAVVVRRQLLAVVRDNYASQSAFLAAWPQVRPATWKEWVHRSEPRLPNADFLVQLARRPLMSLDGRRQYVSLDGLLLGVGSLYRPPLPLQRPTVPAGG